MGRLPRVAALVVATLATLLVAPLSCAGDGPCRYNSDCKNAYCLAGECKRDCVDTALDCKAGFFCNAIAQCEPLSGDAAAPRDASPEGAPPGSDGASEDGASAGDSAPPGDSGGDSSSGAKRELDLCAGDSECRAPWVCRTFVKGGAAQRCVRTCATSSQCPSGTGCFGGVCTWSDVGRACSSGPTCQESCLVGPGTCTTSCATGADCPNGYGCMPVAAQRVCVKVEAYCQASQAQACVVPAACDTGAVLVSGCTLACSSAADCPRRAAGLAPWTCPASGLCRRPGDVYGPLGNGQPAEYACNAQSEIVNVCNDGQHIDFDQFTVPAPPSVSCGASLTVPGTTGDVCVDSCRFQGGCPFGFACTAVGSVNGTRIGLCLPALGGGEVGAGCVRDGDCAFGYCSRGKCSRDCTSDGVCPTGSSCTAVASGPPVEGAPFRRCE